MFSAFTKKYVCSFAVAASVCLGTLHAGNAAVWPDHINQANIYIDQILADNNEYGSPAQLGYNAGGSLIAVTQCSSFTTLLLKNTYPYVVTNTALTALTGSTLPTAEKWYTAIKNETADVVSGLAFHKRNTVAAIQAGDILASAYTTTGNTGHTMMVAQIHSAVKNVAPPHPIPNVTTVNKYIIKIFDSCKSGHGIASTNTAYPDSRYMKQWNGTSWVSDSGIGSGYFVAYENPQTGELVAWAWSTYSKTTSFYYAVTPPDGSVYEYRPMVAGYLSGI